MTHSELYSAITSNGISLHPCNAHDSIPIDETAIYYMDIEELTGIYNDIISEQNITTVINGWKCIEVNTNDNGSFEYNGKWYFARFNISEHEQLLKYSKQLENEFF